MIFVICFVLAFLPVHLLFRTKIIHKERMPKNKKCIVTCNHYSNFDVVLLDVLFARKFRYMAKKELFKNKFSSFILKGLGGFEVDRDNVSTSVFKKTLSLLKEDKQVFIFPEGTRNKSGSEEMGSVKSGIIVFASKGDCKIIPMLMYRKPQIFRKNYIIVGEPFELVGENVSRLSKEEVENNLERYEAVMSELRKEVDEYANNRKKR